MLVVRPGRGLSICHPGAVKGFISQLRSSFPPVHVQEGTGVGDYKVQMHPSLTGMRLVPCISAASESLNPAFLATGRNGFLALKSRVPQLRISGLRPRCVSDGSSDEPGGDGDTGRSKKERDWDEAWLSYSKGDASPEPRPPNGDPRSKSGGPRLTEWGGSVRGGKYEMGEGADRVLDAFGSADILLYAAFVVLALFCVLVNLIPPSPQ